MDVDYCLVFDEDGNLPKLNRGEIGSLISMMESSDLELGNKLTIKENGVKKEFVIREAVKDAAFGLNLKLKKKK